MIVPAAMFIETAIDQLKSIETVTGWGSEAWVPPAQAKELRSAVPSASDDFVNGYQLGIQTARVLLSGMPAAVFNKISI